MSETHETFFEEGRKYLKTARGGLKRPEVFTEEILYNVVAMAMEKTIMGILIYNGTLADNHTFSDLVDALRRIKAVDDETAADLLDFEQYQTICSVFDGYQRKKMDREVILRMVDTAAAIEEQAHRLCVDSGPAAVATTEERGYDVPHFMNAGNGKRGPTGQEEHLMAKAGIKAGVCGKTTEVDAAMDGKICNIVIKSDCTAIQKLAEELKQVNPMMEIAFKPKTPTVIEMGMRHCFHAACPVPAGIIKAVEVAAGYALPVDAGITVSN